MSKYFAFFAYLLSIVGVLGILIFRRKDEFAIYHAKQSLGIALIATGIFVAWVVFGWIISWIPYVGFIFAMALFSLVIAAYLVLFVCWIMGMRYTLEEKMQPVPIVGGIIIRLFK